MNDAIRQGWETTKRHKYVLVALFLYRLLWGFFLYRFIDAVVTPILVRYPDEHPLGEAAKQLFAIEAQFRLLKTNLADHTLLMLAGMLLLRMLLTPILNAGLYYSFAYAEDQGGTQVLQGIRRSWKKVSLLYGAEKLIALAPAFWLIPFGRSAYLEVPNAMSWLGQMLPYAAGWALWMLAVHLPFLFMQFSAAAGDSPWQGALRSARRLLPLLGVTILLPLLSLLGSAAVSGAALIWTGLLAIALNQAFHLARSMIALWTAACQHRLWQREDA
ncbi:hypothetical protein SAMN05216312_11582 [Cohnella sp. OV330]|uniref:hypothetical protein n=1 Tax=Cohnella sp. OV330 TaxID=1855288 RepID=UPI0008E7C4E2|nr:hypothetical protein [Cohnella sp. OV330]SFB59377.1 hypothetical protein SAMN05216312_11582 [Cohnella sp. OV330]